MKLNKKIVYDKTNTLYEVIDDNVRTIQHVFISPLSLSFSKCILGNKLMKLPGMDPMLTFCLATPEHAGQNCQITNNILTRT